MTVTETAPSVGTLPRPQALGLADGPAALVLTPDGPGVSDLLADLAAGREPASWPVAAACLAATRAGDIGAALAACGDDPVGAVNRLVLAPSPAHLAAARSVGDGEPILRAVTAVAAYVAGLTDELPDPVDVDGEVAALVLTTLASRSLEQGEPVAALHRLQEATERAAGVGAALHGRALATLAEHQHDLHGPSPDVLATYDEALAALGGTDDQVLRAGVEMQRAVVAHELAGDQRHRLVEAIQGYQRALLVLGEEDHPEEFAFGSVNVALAILALPMTQASDQVRLGVAVQSLRAALRVYRPDTHPLEWSSAQLNLANALQYLPSRHQEDNLAEAVTLYEELLAARSPEEDPAGCARVLANQANALAHLGIFDHATDKYRQARELFWQIGDPDAVGVVDAQLRTIAEAEEARS